jgi:hypothetical protein
VLAVEPGRFNDLIDGRGWWRRPPGWIFHLLFIPPVLVVLWNASLPDGTFSILGVMAYGLAVLAIMGLAAAWTGRLLAYLVPNERARWGTAAVWAVVPAAAGLVLALLLLHVPLRARFEVSKGAFDDALASNGLPTEAPRGDPLFDAIDATRVGLYFVYWVERRDDGSAFFYEEPYGSAGFAYLPDGPPGAEVDELRCFELSASDQAPRYLRLGGDWYSFTNC